LIYPAPPFCCCEDILHQSKQLVLTGPGPARGPGLAPVLELALEPALALAMMILIESAH